MSIKHRIICAIIAFLMLFTLAACSGTIGDLPPEVTLDDTTANDTTKSPDTTESPDTTTNAGDTNPPEIVSYVEPHFSALTPSPAECVFGSSEVEVTAYEVDRCHIIELDDSYVAPVIYGVETYDDKSSVRRDASLKIINRHTGKTEADFPIDGDLTPASLYSVTDDGYVLYDVEYNPPGVVSRERFWTLTLKDGVFSIKSSDTYDGNRRAYLYTSPDGKHKAYREYIPDEDIYGMFIEDADGNVTRITKDYPINPDFPDGWWIGYVPRGFLDNDTLIYNTGAEGIVGYGIYRISTKENIEFEENHNVFAVIDGKAYAANTYYASTNSLGTIDRDGIYTAISVPDVYSRLVFADEQDIMDTCGENWIFAPCDSDNLNYPHRAPAFYLFSEDMSTVTAKIDIPSDRMVERSFTGDGRLILFLSKKRNVEENDNKISDLKNLTDLLSMTAKEIREKYGDLPLKTNSTTSTGECSININGNRRATVVFGGWNSRYLNGYHLQVRGDLYPSYIKMNADSTGGIGIANGEQINAYANASDFENVYFDNKGDVYMSITFNGCILELCVDPDWDIYFPTADKEEKEEALEKFKADPRGKVKSIKIYAGEDLRQKLFEIKREEQNELIGELLSLTVQQIEEKYGPLTETYFQNDRSAKMYYPAQLVGVNLTFDLTDGEVPSGTHIPDKVIINEFYDRSFMGMKIGSEISVFSPAESYISAWYDEKIGCFSSFEANGLIITLITGGEGSKVGIGTDEWTEKFTQSPTGFIRAIVIERPEATN